MNEEIWMDIDGLEGYFQISNVKRVRALKYGTRYGIRVRQPPKIMEPFIHGQGYYTVYLGITGIHIKRFYRIHKLWADVYLPNPDNKPYINHKDGNKLNNEDSNLEWCTHAENIQHAFRHGLMNNKKGKEHPLSKLDEDKVVNIINSPLSAYKLSKIYGVNRSIVCDVRNGVTWNHVTGLPKKNPKLKIYK